jgi:hypothetical protein
MSRPIAKARRCDCDECGSGKFKTRQSLREHQAAAHWPRIHVQISQQGPSARPSPVACSLRDRSRSRRPLQCGAGEACSSVGCLRTSDLKTHVLRCKPFLKALGRDRLVGWEEVRGSFRPDGKLNQPSASRASEGARASLLRVNTCSEVAPHRNLMTSTARARTRTATDRTRRTRARTRTELTVFGQVRPYHSTSPCLKPLDLTSIWSSTSDDGK